MPASPAVEMRSITRVFPGLTRPVVANNRIDLTIQPGEFHVIMGENGAGKSTLMNILYGLLQPDAGEVRLFGQAVSIKNPRQAIELGVGMIHQHFMLVPSFTIGENIVLGHEPTTAALLDTHAIRSQVRALSARLKLDVNPDVRVWDTAVGVQQRVEILKALYRGARVLILDEPTAVLTPQEADVLFDALRQLCQQGTTVIMITHKLPEVMAVADHVTVMRDGAVVGRVARAELDERRLAEMMTGRQWTPDRLPRRRSAAQPETILEVAGLSCLDDRQVKSVNGVSFSLRAGEILAIAGVAHNGQEELAEAIMGQRPVAAGKVLFKGQDITNAGVRAIRGLGIGHVPDDRYREGCAPLASVARNMIMAAHDRPPLGNRLFIKLQAARQWANRLLRDYEVKLGHPEAPMLSLSGGNIQKAIVAREIAMTTGCLVAEQPSRGIDIGAAEAIYQRLIELREQGVGVLLISMDLAEILRLSDRILVMYNGQIVGERLPEHTDQRDLGRLMAGLKSSAASAPSAA